MSMLFHSFNPKRLPTLQFKAIWWQKDCPAPASILSPPATPLISIGIMTLGMLAIFLCRCFSTLSTLNVCQHYNSKQYAPACILSPMPRPLTPIGIVTLRMLDICLFRCISTLAILNVFQQYNRKQYACLKGARLLPAFSVPLTRPFTPIRIGEPGNA